MGTPTVSIGAESDRRLTASPNYEDLQSDRLTRVACALALCAERPEEAAPALVAIVTAFESVPVEARLAAGWAVRSLLATSPQLVPLIWPPTPLLARRATIRAVADASFRQSEHLQNRAIVQAAIADPMPAYS